MTHYVKSEILADDLPEERRSLSTREIRCAQVAHLCGIGGHVIERGQAYTRMVELTPDGIAVVNICGAYCHEGE